MMLSLLSAFVRSNLVKTVLTLASLSIYFVAVSLAVTMGGSIDEIASLPMKSIGAETVVQKSGKIPNQMSGAIFPHANAPIYANEIERIASASFVTGFDTALYFWYFDSSFFKSALGVHLETGIYAGILKANLLRGSYPTGGNEILATEDFVKKTGLDAGSRVIMGSDSFLITGILRSQFSGNIAPADLYMDISVAQRIAGNSPEMKELYNITDSNFYNMVVLKTDPLWQGNREKTIQTYGKDYLVFGEQSFKQEIKDQLLLLSSSALLTFAVLGGLLAIGFALMIYYGIKTRENEIALLRMLGWRFSALRNHFMGESILMVGVALLFGNLFYALSLRYIAGIKISMELPWDISAKPHFLPEENSIERIITAPLPVNFNVWSHLIVNLCMIVGCALLTYFLLYRLKNIKPAEFYKA